jgi:hypothetical protein
VSRIEDYSRLQREFLSFNGFWVTVQFVYAEDERRDKQTEIPVFEYRVGKDLYKIVFVSKFGEDGVCRASVGEAKVNNVNAVCDDGYAVCRDENPFCRVLIRPVVPKPERNDLHEQIYGIDVG